MNLLLLEDSDFIDERVVELSGRRLKHMLKIKKISVGSVLKTGVLNGQTGAATIIKILPDSVIAQVDLTENPPPILPLTVVLALPRPKMLKRIIQTLATLGVKNIYLLNTWKVEKSYWQTSCLNESYIREQLILGLEQGCDTLLPEVTIKKSFKPFVEDELVGIAKNNYALVAHPASSSPCPTGIDKPTILAIGPEGGFTDYEIRKFTDVGFKSIHLGKRIQRVETIIPSLLARIFL